MPNGAPAAASPGWHKVEVLRVSKTYRSRRSEHRALIDIGLDVEPGEFVVLLGPSGCGKTTLLRCIAGLEQPDAGEIRVDGAPVFSADRRLYVPPEKRRLSMVFQSYALWPHLRVKDNVAYPLRNQGVAAGAVSERVAGVLRLVGLETLAQSFPGQLSGGQQQRVALARALIGNSGLILFDEPLSNLDAQVRDRLRIELLALQRGLGFAAIYVTHDQAEAMALADRVVVMNEGRIVQAGPPTELYRHPQSKFVAGFLGNPNQMPGTALGADGAYCRVRTALGDVRATGAVATLPAGTAATILFRSEQCVFVPPDRFDIVNRFTATLVRSLYLGTHFEHVVEAGGSQIVVRNAAPAGDTGDRLWLALDADQTFAFPAMAAP